VLPGLVGRHWGGLHHAGFQQLQPAEEPRDLLVRAALIIRGEKVHQVPVAIARGTYQEQSEDPGGTEVTAIPDRGDWLTADGGGQEAAQTVLDFIRRFA
jgi:hypothetical protein